MSLFWMYVTDIVGAIVIAVVLRASTRWSNARVSLISALPVPLMLGCIGLYGAYYRGQPRSSAHHSMNIGTSIMIGTLMFFLIGLAVAFITARMMKPLGADADATF